MLYVEKKGLPQFLNKSDQGCNVKLFVYAGSRKYEFDVSLLKYVSEVKLLIEKKTGIAPADQHLVLNGRKIARGTLRINRITEGSSIYLKGILDVNLHYSAEPAHMFFVHEDWPISRFGDIVQ